jgi:hypothetical protein
MNPIWDFRFEDKPSGNPDPHFCVCLCAINIFILSLALFVFFIVVGAAAFIALEGKIYFFASLSPFKLERLN